MLLGVRPILNHELVRPPAVERESHRIEHLVAVLLELWVAVLEPVEFTLRPLDEAVYRDDHGHVQSPLGRVLRRHDRATNETPAGIAERRFFLRFSRPRPESS